MLYYAIGIFVISVLCISFYLYKRKKTSKQTLKKCKYKIGDKIEDGYLDMATADLQVYASDGTTLVFSSATNYTRVMEKRELWGSGSVSVSAYNCNANKLFVLFESTPYYKNGSSSSSNVMNITVTDTKLSWSGLPTDSVDGSPAIVYIGVY